MLVLTRRRGESLLIGEDIEVIILSATDGNARVGVIAPRRTRIARRELLSRDRRRPTSHPTDPADG